MNNKKYYLVAWTANFGVVPLFLFWAFLLAPILRCFAFLLASVIAVLDAIRLSHRFVAILVLALMTLSVKGNPQLMENDLILAKGEQKELKNDNLKRFSVGNGQVIKVKYFNKSLLVKGLKIGFSDLYIWEKKTKIHYKVYVLSTNSFLKTVQIADSIKNLGLKLEIKGTLATVSGVVSNKLDWILLKKIKKDHIDKIIFNVEIDQTLRREIAAEIYKELYGVGLTSSVCSVFYLDFQCKIKEKNERHKELLSELENKWGVRFIFTSGDYFHKNFRLKMKLLQYEKSDGDTSNLGFSKIETTPQLLFKNGVSELVKNNQIVLKSNRISLNALSEPEVNVTLHHAHQTEIGAEIPFQNIAQTSGNIISPLDWRFAGLKIKTTVIPDENKFLIKYETEFSRPMDRGISGSKEKSSLFAKIGVGYKIFEINYQVSVQEKETIPGLMDIPILNILFGNNTNQKSYRRIEGYLILEENKDETTTL